MSIHANPNLSGIQKFNYLKAQLQGEAARTITGLPLIESNYAHSIALLENHYARRHKIVNAHMKALLDIPSSTNTLASVRMCYDSVVSHIRGLSSLGKSEQSYVDLLVLIIMAKLSTKIQRSLTQDHPNAQWILSDLMAAILKEIQILESGSFNPSNPHNPMPRSKAATLQVNPQEYPNKKPNQYNLLLLKHLKALASLSSHGR